MLSDLFMLAGLGFIAFALWFVFKFEVKVGEEIVNNKIQDVKATLFTSMYVKVKTFFSGLFDKTNK